MFYQRLELLVNVIMNTAGDMLELCSLVVLWDVLATVSTEVMPSAPDGGGDLRLLPKQLVAVFVVELDVRVRHDQDFLQPLGLVSKGIQVIILYCKVLSMKSSVCVHFIWFIFLFLRNQSPILNESNFIKLSHLSVFIGQLDMFLRPNLFCRWAKLLIWENNEERETCAKLRCPSDGQLFRNRLPDGHNFLNDAHLMGKLAAGHPLDWQLPIRWADKKANE